MKAPTDQRLREIALPSATLLVCPWCKDDDFDDVGLKLHIVNGHCDAFNALSTCLPAARKAKSDFSKD
jgi:hypothetical protein